jgi:putative sugar O-methyltransferase
MRSNGGILAPSNHWNWGCGGVNGESQYSNKLYQDKYSNLKQILDPWVGITGMKIVSDSAVKKYEGFLRSIDQFSTLPSDILEFGSKNGWLEADLGSIMDINLISIFSKVGQRKPPFVLEVGGGYGRLAEIFLERFQKDIHYVLIDSVPGSLMYSYLYLKNQFPELKIGSLYAGDKYCESYNCFILPSWRAKETIGNSFDICINIESMQEMLEEHVDYYLKLFEECSINGATIYLSNARDYIFKGDWNIPPNWRPLYLSNTPRSWSPNHPTQIFQKNISGDFSADRLALEGAYQLQLLNWSEMLSV